MNKMSKNIESDKSNGSIELTDKELAVVSGGVKRERNIKMPPVVITGRPH